MDDKCEHGIVECEACINRIQGDAYRTGVKSGAEETAKFVVKYLNAMAGKYFVQEKDDTARLFRSVAKDLQKELAKK